MLVTAGVCRCVHYCVHYSNLHSKCLEGSPMHDRHPQRKAPSLAVRPVSCMLHTCCIQLGSSAYTALSPSTRLFTLLHTGTSRTLTSCLLAECQCQSLQTWFSWWGSQPGHSSISCNPSDHCQPTLVCGITPTGSSNKYNKKMQAHTIQGQNCCPIRVLQTKLFKPQHQMGQRPGRSCTAKLAWYNTQHNRVLSATRFQQKVPIPRSLL